MWLDVLRERGVDPQLTDSGRLLTLRRDGEVVSWRMRRFRRTPRPSEVSPVEAEWALWLPRVTGALRERLDRLDIAWVSDSGDLNLRTPWAHISYDAMPHARPQAGQVPAVRRSRGTLGTLQFLLEAPDPASQVRIAGAVNLSQARVSQVIKDLRREELVERQPGGWQLTSAERAFDVWLAAVEPATTVTTTWYSLAPARDQASAVWERAAADRAESRLCGDWAADLLAPWRMPAIVTFHVDRTLDLESAGFVPADQDSATLALHVGPIPPDWRPDPRVVAAMTPVELPYPVAPVTEIVREIRATGGSDAAQAAQELASAWLRARAQVASIVSR